MNVLEQLESKKDFTDSESHIATYILEHLDDVMNMSIGDLTNATYTSNGTIIRLCRKLDLEGFKEFKVKLIKDYEKSHREKTEVNYNSPFFYKESPQSIMSTISLIERNAIDACYASVSPSKIKEAAELIRRSRHVYIFSAGDTQAMSSEFCYMLQKIGIYVIVANRYQENAHITYNATKEDVAILPSYRGGILHYSTFMRELKKSGCRTILITSRQDIPADISLVFPSLETAEGRAAGYYSLTAIRYILDCIYGVIYSSDLPLYGEMRKETDRIAEENIRIEENSRK